MAVIPDFRSTTLIAFLKQNVAAGSTIYTDGLKSFGGLEEAGFKHVPRSQPLRVELRKGAKSVVPLADRAVGNLQQWLIGTHHGVSRDQLQAYLDEFVFRHNRRRQPMARSRPCSVSGLRVSPRLIGRYGMRRICPSRAPRADHNLLGFAETTR
jgi:transposase-like protein